MKSKIFARLKQEYSSLGLGDAILQAQADALAKLGLVTDDNIETVVEAQKEYLEQLQKSNDSRVTEAVEKARKKATEEAEKKAQEAEEKRKKDEAAAAAKKAEEEAAAKKAEEEAAAKKAAEEEEKRKQEEFRKNNEIPVWFKKLQEEQMAAAKERQAQYEETIKTLTENAKASNTSFEERLSKLMEENKTLSDNYTKMQKEAEAAALSKAKAEKHQKILAQAKELGIPQYRIEEGFNIADDASDDAITSYLSTVAKNSKANQMPQGGAGFLNSGNAPSDAEVDGIADLLVH